VRSCAIAVQHLLHLHLHLLLLHLLLEHTLFQTWFHHHHHHLHLHHQLHQLQAVLKMMWMPEAVSMGSLTSPTASA
jgi:hypothetical protein